MKGLLKENSATIRNLATSLRGDGKTMEADILRRIAHSIDACLATPPFETAQRLSGRIYSECVEPLISVNGFDGPKCADLLMPYLVTPESDIPPMTANEQWEMRKFLALSHEDGKCHIYGDDGELQCSNTARHGRSLDFRRESISDLLENIQLTHLKEYQENRDTPESDAMEDARNTAAYISAIFGVSRPQVSADPGNDPALDRATTMIAGYGKRDHGGEPMPVKQKYIDGIPRRANMDHWHPVEKQINEALQAVELMGGDVLLTWAVVFLGKAQAKVADYLDQQADKINSPILEKKEVEE